MDPQTSRNLESAGEPGSGPGLPDEIVWTVHPARRNPIQAVAVFGVLVLIPLAIHMALADPLLVICGGLLLGISLGSYFFPTTVRLSNRGVSLRTFWGQRTRSWSCFRSIQHDREYVRLCTLGRPSRLDHYRGTLLRFDRNRDQVLRFVRSRISTPTAEEPA